MDDIYGKIQEYFHVPLRPDLFLGITSLFNTEA
jgi:hypothetical protein